MQMPTGLCTDMHVNFHERERWAQMHVCIDVCMLLYINTYTCMYLCANTLYVDGRVFVEVLVCACMQRCGCGI